MAAVEKFQAGVAAYVTGTAGNYDMHGLLQVDMY
jgi:hypothetical protein